MTDYEMKVAEIYESIDTKERQEILKLDALLEQYQALMGTQDTNITDKIVTVKGKYDDLKARLCTEYNRFKKMMAVPIEEQRRNFANSKHILLEEGTENEGQKMYERKMDFQGYWDPVFPAAEEVQLKLPTVSRMKIDTVRDLLQNPQAQETAAYITQAATFISSQVGKIYDILDLSLEDFKELHEGLTNYVNMKSQGKIDFMMDFVTEIYRSPWIWNKLTSKDQNAIKYAMERDGDSFTAEECKPMRESREQNLARIILNNSKVLRSCSPMIKEWEELGELPFDVARTDEINKSAVLYCGKYLVDHVIPKREQLYNQVVRTDLETMLKIKRATEKYISPDEWDGLKIGKICRIATSLMLFDIEHNRLTPKQRSLAFDVITDFYSRLHSAPTAVKAKIKEGIGAISTTANPMPALE